MSKSDYPPEYNATHGPMYPPQGSNYPQPPAYGFPGYGVPQPGPPTAPYPTSLNAPLFPGQPGAYPPGPYPGQPQPAGPPGYPNPPPMPPIIPPTIPSDMLATGKIISARTTSNSVYLRTTEVGVWLSLGCMWFQLCQKYVFALTVDIFGPLSKSTLTSVLNICPCLCTINQYLHVL